MDVCARVCVILAVSVCECVCGCMGVGGGRGCTSSAHEFGSVLLWMLWARVCVIL